MIGEAVKTGLRVHLDLRYLPPLSFCTDGSPIGRSGIIGTAMKSGARTPLTCLHKDASITVVVSVEDTINHTARRCYHLSRDEAIVASRRSV